MMRPPFSLILIFSFVLGCFFGFYDYEALSFFFFLCFCLEVCFDFGFLGL